MRNECLGATRPIAVSNRFIARGPRQGATNIVAVTVLLRPARAMREQKAGERSVAAKHRKVEGRRGPITAANCDRPTELDHKHDGRITALGGEFGKYSQLGVAEPARKIGPRRLDT